MDLANMIVPSKTIKIEYPQHDGLMIDIAYLTRDELMKLREKATTQKFSKKSRQLEDNIDSDLFQDLYIKAVIKGWEGFKYRYLKSMVPVDLSRVPSEEYLEGEGLFEYSKDNATILMKNCSDFDNWISSQLDEVENFTRDS